MDKAPHRGTTFGLLYKTVCSIYFERPMWSLKSINLISILVLAALSCIPSWSVRAEMPESAFEASCQHEEFRFKVLFRSVTNDATADDMMVSIVQDSVKIPVTAKPAWYHSAKLKFSSKSLCDKIPAFSFGPTKVLLVLSWDNRPNFNRTSLVLYAPSSKKVIQVKDDIGAVKSQGKATYVAKKPSANTLELRLVRLESDYSKIETEEDWLVVSLKDSDLQTRWSKR